MTFREKLKQEHPECVEYKLCPSDYGYERPTKNEDKGLCSADTIETCKKCWGREIPTENPNKLTDKEKKSMVEAMKVIRDICHEAYPYCCDDCPLTYPGEWAIPEEDEK